MAITITDLENLVRNANVPYGKTDQPDELVIAAPAQNYSGPSLVEHPKLGSVFPISLKLSEKGEMFCAKVNWCFDITGSSHTELFFTLCSGMQAAPGPVQFGYYPTSGNVTAMIELPLLDNVLTQRQFNYCVEQLHECVNEQGYILATALQRGQEALLDSKVRAFLGNEALQAVDSL
jgi:hypothetical protein